MEIDSGRIVESAFAYRVQVEEYEGETGNLSQKKEKTRE